MHVIANRLPPPTHSSSLQIPCRHSCSSALLDELSSPNRNTNNSAKCTGKANPRLKLRWIKILPYSLIMLSGSTSKVGSSEENRRALGGQTYSYLAAMYRQAAAFRGEWYCSNSGAVQIRWKMSKAKNCVSKSRPSFWQCRLMREMQRSL